MRHLIPDCFTVKHLVGRVVLIITSIFNRCIHNTLVYGQNVKYVLKIASKYQSNYSLLVVFIAQKIEILDRKSVV